MLDVAQEPLLVTSRELCDMLGGVSRMTVSRWRAVGFLPKPSYVGPNGRVVAWSYQAIRAWQAAGTPWADPQLAREAIKNIGKRELRRKWLPPEPSKQETPQAKVLIDRMERLLNEAEVINRDLQEELGVAVPGERFLQLRRELFLLQSEDSENDS